MKECEYEREEMFCDENQTEYLTGKVLKTYFGSVIHDKYTTSIRPWNSEGIENFRSNLPSRIAVRGLHVPNRGLYAPPP